MSEDAIATNGAIDGGYQWSSPTRSASSRCGPLSADHTGLSSAAASTLGHAFRAVARQQARAHGMPVHPGIKIRRQQQLDYGDRRPLQQQAAGKRPASQQSPHALEYIG